MKGFVDKQLEAVLECLNSAFQADPAALHALCLNRVPCGLALADHPTVATSQIPGATVDEWYTVSALGLLNGVLTAAGIPPIAMTLGPLNEDEMRPILGFRRAPEG